MRPLSIHYDGPDDGEFYEIDPVTNEKSAVLMLRANRDYKVFFQEGHSYCVSSSPESTFSLKLGEGATEAFVHCKIGENQSIIGFDGVGIKVEVDSAAASATTPAAPPPPADSPAAASATTSAAPPPPADSPAADAIDPDIPSVVASTDSDAPADQIKKNADTNGWKSRAGQKAEANERVRQLLEQDPTLLDNIRQLARLIGRSWEYTKTLPAVEHAETARNEATRRRNELPLSPEMLNAIPDAEAELKRLVGQSLEDSERERNLPRKRKAACERL
jgi:hypothetical protein